MGFDGLLAVTLWLSRPAWLAFRKRRSGYGTVFHRDGIPEALATVSFRRAWLRGAHPP